MMYADYFILSACAFSVAYIPFFIIAQLRFAHIMQNEGYNNKNYFQWIKKNFLLAYVPLIGLCAVLMVAELAMYAFIYNSMFYDMELIIAYVIATMLIVLIVVILLTKYIRAIKMESEAGTRPLVCSKRFVSVFMISSLIVSVIITLLNVYHAAIQAVFFLPLAVPLLAPLANLIAHGSKAPSADNA